MQSVSSRIWTRVTMSISYDDNNYTPYKMYNIYTHNLCPLQAGDTVAIQNPLNR